MVLRVILFFIGSLCYALLNILSQLSKEEDGSYAYSLPTVVLMAEATKLCLSVAFLRSEVGSFGQAVSATIGTSPSVWLVCLIPSVLYGVNNMLDMLNNQYMDPASEQILVFQKPLGVRKWLSLVLLFLGEVLASLSARSDGVAAGSMFIKPLGFVLVAIYCSISASASVYNEWLYKVYCSSENVHACNIRLYVFGCVFLLTTHSLKSASVTLNPWELTRGFNIYTWGLVLTYACMGLILSQIMKFFDNIVKLFISGSSIYLSAVLSWALLGFTPTPNFLGALVVVTAAVLMFNLESILPSTKKAD